MRFEYESQYLLQEQRKRIEEGKEPVDQEQQQLKDDKKSIALAKLQEKDRNMKR